MGRRSLNLRSPDREGPKEPMAVDEAAFSPWRRTSRKQAESINETDSPVSRAKLHHARIRSEASAVKSPPHLLRRLQISRHFPKSEPGRGERG
jgi:hypothetical protein